MVNRRTPTLKKEDLADIASTLVFVAGLFLVGTLLLFLIRVQRGLLGIILAGLAAALMIFWMREIRRLVKGELEPIKSLKKWTYDIFESDDTVTIIAEVPGPAEEVEVKLKTRSLLIFGGQKFKKKVSVPRSLNLIESTYVNGVLNVKMGKTRKEKENISRDDSLKFSDS
jgi:HSP20 family molecular chaperone IbpA